MDLLDLAESIDRLVAIDPAELADMESIESLQRQMTRLDAVVTGATAAFDASGNWALSGARSTTAWLTTRCRISKGRARRLVRRGRELRSLPAFSRAWCDGDITVDQVDMVLAVSRPATESDLARDESMLVEQAATLRPDQFARALHYWGQLADPDGAESDEASRRARREVYLESSFLGMWLGKITLDPISGAIVGEELARVEKLLFEADWADAHQALGREPGVGDLQRTPGQRRADALVEMAARSRMAPRDGRRPAPLFTVLVDYETLHGRVCELGAGTAVTPGALVPWLDQAYVERAVFAPDRRVEVSATARLFTGATRRAIELRDRECTHPYCDVGSSRCQVDHRLPYRVGGSTTQENGQLLCGYHNRLREKQRCPDEDPHVG